MPRNYKSTSTNEHQIAINKKLKDKPTYKIIVLGCGGVGKVSSLKNLIDFWML
jgi:GTPase SAR1 family protein